jgi:hypothetical protein
MEPAWEIGMTFLETTILSKVRAFPRDGLRPGGLQVVEAGHPEIGALDHPVAPVEVLLQRKHEHCKTKSDENSSIMEDKEF